MRYLQSSRLLSSWVRYLQQGFLAATLQYPPPLAFRAPSPDTMIDSISQSVFEASLLYRAAIAYTARDIDSYAITRKKDFRRFFGAKASGHPVGVHEMHLQLCPTYAQTHRKVPVKRKLFPNMVGLMVRSDRLTR